MTMYNQQNVTVGQWVALKAFVREGYTSSTWFPREASFLEEKPSHHVYGPITLNLPHWRDHMQAFCSVVPKNFQPTTGITDSHVWTIMEGHVAECQMMAAPTSQAGTVQTSLCWPTKLWQNGNVIFNC